MYLFVKLWGNVHYVSGEGKNGGKKGDRPQEKRRVSQPSQAKARQGTKRGMRAKHACGHQPTCFVVVLPTTTPTHHSLSFVLSCLFPCPLPFPACVCECVSDGGWAWWLVACGLVQAHVWPSRHHHSLALCLLPHPFFLSLLPPFLSFPLPLPLPLVVVVDEKRQVGRHAIHTPPSPLCLVPCVWWWVCGCGVWWCWLARHACMGGTSGCGWCVWPLVPPTTLVVPVVPVSVVLVSMSPPLFPLTLTHTQAWHTTTPHTHTHGWWLVHFGPWCVCVCGHGVGCRRAWLATHTTTHSFCPTPLHQSSCCCWCCWWWMWWMWWWQRGCCGVCGHLVHSLAVLVLSTPPSTHTHTRGGGHVVVVAVCVVWLPPPLCAIPTNHHHCVRCPALSAVCVCVRVCEWWHQAQRRTVVARTLVCG